MSELRALSADLMRYIPMDSAAFDEDYRSTPENTQSLPALKFQKRDLEELWGNIKDKLRQIRESPRLTLPEEAESINLNEITKQVRHAKKFYRTSMISIDESIEAITRINNPPTNPVTSPIVTPTNNSSSFNVPPCDMPIFSGDFKSWASLSDWGSGRLSSDLW